jgi:predicted ester cyclase
MNRNPYRPSLQSLPPSWDDFGDMAHRRITRRRWTYQLLLICVVVLNAFFAGISAASAAEADAAMSNAATIRSQIEMMNRGDWKGALDYYTSDSRNFGRPVGRAVMSRIFEDIYGTFPDFRAEILDMAAVGDSVIVRTRTSGTHKGVGKIPVNGGMLVGVAPTDKHFEVSAIHWYKLKDGKIVDHYATRDDLAMMQQLGLSPEPKPFDWGKFAADANKH